MGNQRFSPEFKDEAVRQIVDCGYSVAEDPISTFWIEVNDFQVSL